MFDEKMKKLLELEIKNTYKGLFDDNLIENCSFKSDMYDVEGEMLKIVKNMKTARQLLDKYQKRSGLKDGQIESIVGIKEFGSFKNNDTFDKIKLFMITVCLHLSFDEAKEIFKHASIFLDPVHSIDDCAYSFYMKNYNKVESAKENVEEFKAVLNHSQQFDKSKNIIGAK